MVGGPKFRQDAIKQLKLPRRTVQVGAEQAKGSMRVVTFITVVNRSMDKNLTPLQFRQYTQDALKMIPVQQKIVYVYF